MLRILISNFRVSKLVIPVNNDKHVSRHYRSTHVVIFSLLSADVAVATPLISMGALLGKTTYMQLVFMGIVELIMFTVNKYVGEHLLMVSLRLLPQRQKTIYHARFSGIAENKRSKLDDERGAEIERDRIFDFSWNENR